jgi:transposase-like protein
MAGSFVGVEIIYMARRFSEAEKQAALADLKNGMTLEQASKKHKCSSASLMQWKKAVDQGAKVVVKKTGAKVAIREGRALHPFALRGLTRQLSMLLMPADTQPMIREGTCYENSF